MLALSLAPCSRQPSLISRRCVNFLDKYGKLLIDLVGNRASPDEICLSLGVCTNPSCRLFPNKRSNIELPRMKVNPEVRCCRDIETARTLARSLPRSLVATQLSIWTWLEELINKWTSKHLPIVDFDGDFFSGTSGQLHFSYHGATRCADSTHARHQHLPRSRLAWP